MISGLAIAALSAALCGQAAQPDDAQDSASQVASSEDRPEEKGWVRPSKDKLRVLYSARYKRDLGEFELFKTNEEEWTRPYVSKDEARLIVGTRSGRILALDAATGSLLWQRRDMGTIGVSIAEHQDMVLLGSDSDLVALNRATGETRWRLDIDGRIGGDITIHKGMVVLPVRPNAFVAVEVSAKGGTKKWRVRRPTPDGITVRGQAAARLDPDNNFAYLGFSDGALVSVTLDEGATRWVTQLGDNRDFFADIDTQPVLVEGGKAVLAASYNTGLFKVNAENGEVIFKKGDLTRLIGLVPAEGGVVAATHGDGQVIGLYGASGAVRWRYRLKRGAPTPPVAIEGGYLLAGCTEGPTAILKASTGEPVQLIDLSSGTSVSPFVRGKYLAAMANKGLLLGFRRGSLSGRSP